MDMILSIPLFIALIFTPLTQLDTDFNPGDFGSFTEQFEHGEVVFQCNEKSPRQLYIIGISHRDSFTRENGPDTVMSQVEAYRIGEWLNQHKDIELLLPEGYFVEESVFSVRDSVLKDSSGRDRIKPFNTKTLEDKLGDSNVHTTAELLLMQSHGLKSRQVEDSALYDAVLGQLRQFEMCGCCLDKARQAKAGLDYLQERRTAEMLQKIPEVIGSEYMGGRIKNEKAIFTIGLNHMPDIIKYLKQSQIRIKSPAITSYDDYEADVKLLNENFGITIIVPKTLKKKMYGSSLAQLDHP